jgi:hypothetical protein
MKKNIVKETIFQIGESLRNLYVELKIKNILRDFNPHPEFYEEEKNKIKNIEIDKLIKYLKEIIEISINVNIERVLNDKISKNK